MYILNSGRYPELSLIFDTMSWKIQVNKLLVKRLPIIQRGAKGTSLNRAQRIALIYINQNERRHKDVKLLAKRLIQEYNLKRVMRFTYVDSKKKDIPNWQMQKLDSGFICQNDLNFWGKPEDNMDLFCQEPFDILINLESSLPVPLIYTVRNSRAAMKIAVRQDCRNEDYDVLIEPKAGESREHQIDRLLKFLTTTQLQ